jgi:molybdopterin-guanine dinucleotide biosynthesis protein A
VLALERERRSERDSEAGLPPKAAVTGLCLCGGASRRMGRDKALAELGERRLIDYPLSALAAVAGTTLLACGESPRYAELGLPLVLDTGPGAGPLRGLLAGLEAARTEWVVVAACDMPRLCATALEALLAHASQNDLDVCLAEIERGTQPLFGVYRARCAAAVRAALERGERRLVAFHGEAPGGRPLCVGSLRLERFADEACNLNTPEELRAERARASGRKAGAS